VHRGHYRSDTRGVNLNRVYGAPCPREHPSVYAIRALVTQLHGLGTLRFYVDCHAHSNKRGCFLFGNAMPHDVTQMTESMLYAKLVEANCRWLDFEGCVFSESNMSRKDWRDTGVGKEGSARVAVYRMTNLTHVYTLECNYNMGRRVNRLGHPHTPPGSDPHRSLSPQPPLRCLSPKYTPEAWHAVGKALAVSALDAVGANPCSRLGAPGDEAERGMMRLRSTVTAWLRTNERKAAESGAKREGKREGSDEGDGSGSDGGGQGVPLLLRRRDVRFRRAVEGGAGAV